jgi:hypothetical protein
MTSRPDRTEASTALATVGVRSLARGTGSSLFAAMLATSWAAAYSSLTVPALRASAADRRWTTHVVVAMSADRPVAYLPLYVSAQPSLPANCSVEEHFGTGIEPRRLVLLGGRGEMVADVVYAAGLDPSARAEVGGQVVREAVEFARRQGMAAAAFFVDDHQARTVFEPAGPHRSVPGASRLVLAGLGTDLDAYLATLRGSARSVVRRDLRDFDRSGLMVARVPAGHVLDEAAPLVTATKKAHGETEPPALVGFRLREWADRAAEHTAYVVRDGRAIVCVSLGAVVGDNLEMYEIGMVPSHTARHPAYLQALLYAPLRHAQERGLGRLTLGFGADRPKLLRGARAVLTSHVFYPGSDHDG